MELLFLSPCSKEKISNMIQIKTLVFNPFQENTYLIHNETGACVIVDPGCENTAEEQELLAFITAQQLKPELLLLTHGHIDHILGLDFVYRTWGLKPWIHQADEYLLERADTAAQLFGMRYKGYHGIAGYLDTLKEITFQGSQWPLFHTPGHSKGSVSIWLQEEGELLSGDVLFYRSVGRSDFAESNPEDLVNSIKTKLYTLPENTRVWPGHGPSTTIGEEKQMNPFVR